MTTTAPETVTPAELAADQIAQNAPASPAATPAAPQYVKPADPIDVQKTAGNVQAPTAAPAGAPQVDSLGRAFDAGKFAPRFDSRGRWINKNAGRKPTTPAGAQESGKSFVPPDAAPAAPTAQPITPAAAIGPQSDRFDLAAEMYCRASYSIADGIFSGDGEWLPESDGEHLALRAAVATYLRHKNTDDLPPGLALALAAGTYGAKRMSRPRTLSRLRMFGYWIRARIYAWRTGRRLDDLPPQPPAPQSEQSPLPPQRGPQTVHEATIDHMTGAAP
jgi:hypothetical protein